LAGKFGMRLLIKKFPERVLKKLYGKIISDIIALKLLKIFTP
jgi:hypothetical protein